MASDMINPECWPKIILFGDSLTQQCFSSEGRWGSLLADNLQRKCDLVNRGFSGYNVRWCKFLLPQLVTEEDTDTTVAVTIFLGANDANDANSKQHVPLEEYQDGLMEMVEYLQSIGIEREKIILISPPAFDEKAWGKNCESKGMPLTKFNKTTGEYAKLCIEAANECGTLSVDLYSEMMKAEGWEDMLTDGLHLGSKGATLLFELLHPIINKLTSHLPVIFPLWDQIDDKNPEASLCPVAEST